MIKILYAFLIFIFLSSCSDQPVQVSAQKEIKNKNTISDSIQKPLNERLQKNGSDTTTVDAANEVTVKVLYRNSYCGGAWPPEEVLEEYKKEYPLINSMIILQDRNGGKIAAKTDEKGFIHQPINAGTYNYYMSAKISKKVSESFNPSCKTWLETTFGKLTIVDGKTDKYKILFEFGCNPCEPPRP